MMKYLQVSMCVLLATGLCLPSVASPVHTFFSIRSQSVRASRDLLGWQDYINCYKPDQDCYAAFAATVEYDQSIRAHNLANYFFGCNQLTFSGSQVANRGACDLLADYFGLSTQFQSRVTSAPSIKNALVDASFYWAFDPWCQRSYLRIHAPLVYTRWDMNLCETIVSSGSSGYPSGYMANSAVPAADLEPSVLQAWCCPKQVGDIQPLTFGRICEKKQKVGLSEIQVAAGYNLVLTEDAHFGWNVRCSIPTGNRSRGLYLFEPIIGNGGRWELGCGLTGHGTLWVDECERHSVRVYSDINMTHLFANRQRRSFDFVQAGKLSRYMLLEEMGPPVVYGLGLNIGNPVVEVPAAVQYHGALIPAVNKTTLDATIGIALQIDFVLKLAYRHNCFGLDVGYNAWVRTPERLSCRQKFPDQMFAFKGDAQVYGFDVLNPVMYVALNATQSQATIHAGQGQGNSNFANNNADNAAVAVFSGTPLVTSDGTTAVKGSQPAVLLGDKDIDNFSGLAPKAVSNMFFVHGFYDFKNRSTSLTPFIGAGANIEIGSNCWGAATALSQWGVWLKLGCYT